MNKLKPQYIFLAGGHSAGPIMPLLAVVEEWHKEHSTVRPVLLDIKGSVSERLAKEEHLIFERIITGKLRRYWAWPNLLLPLLVLIGFFQSLYLVAKYRPVAVLGAGGFVQIPVVLAAWFLRVPRFIHQQDVAPTLSNSLCAPFANLITVTFENSIRDFPQGTGLGNQYISTNKVIWTGNPTRYKLDHTETTKVQALKKFELHNNLPVLLVIGGGTGAAGLNNLIYQDLRALTSVVQVLHVTGRGKLKHPRATNYHPFEYLSDMKSAYAAADIILSRVGLGAMTDIAAVKKPAIFIPMPESHQEKNAELIYKAKAGIVLDQSTTTISDLISTIRKLLFDPNKVNQITHNLSKLFPDNAAHKVYKVISGYLKKHASK